MLSRIILALGIIGGLVMLVGAIFAAGHDIGSKQADAQWQARWDAAQTKAEAEARAEEQRQQIAIEKVRNDADEQLRQARADAAVSRAAADSLREHAARFAEQASQCASASTGGQAVASPSVVLADVLARIDTRAGELAAAYDIARIEGLSCERAYDAVSQSGAGDDRENQ